MASPSSFLASILLGSLFISPSFSRPIITVVDTAKHSIVNQVCSKAKNPSMCLQILPHDGNLQAVAKSVVSSGHEYAEDTIVNVMDAAMGSTEPQLKKKYSSCLTNMKTADAALAKAIKEVGSGDFSGLGLGRAAATAKAETHKCISLFQSQPADPFYILQGINNFGDVYVDIISIISTMLKK
ncbi:pectinmethylesterase inhibitor [Tripterygium wilfordii]|uniref:Pectinmethylesterase inhibitor n=2 Tax=Tripterygium wilfordii TaxID=458696 RepID=A0A7J7CSL0_TRIWF|nr:pectinmethylesterase inhibitor [Tripterygium wilfordii]